MNFVVPMGVQADPTSAYTLDIVLSAVREHDDTVTGVAHIKECESNQLTDEAGNVLYTAEPDMRFHLYKRV